jgi:hypothetical protein
MLYRIISIQKLFLENYFFILLSCLPKCMLTVYMHFLHFYLLNGYGIFLSCFGITFFLNFQNIQNVVLTQFLLLLFKSFPI